MQARPRPSLDTNVSQYASHALHLHSADSGPSSSTAPCDSAGSSLVDPFASPREDSRTADLASSVHEQASPTLAHQRSRSHSVTSQGCTISKNGVVYQEYYIAKYDYEPESPNYLPFSAGQLIKIIRKHSSGWWDGELAGRRGWFPSNYLYSDSSRLVRVRSNSLESVRPALRSDPVFAMFPFPWLLMFQGISGHVNPRSTVLVHCPVMPIQPDCWYSPSSPRPEPASTRRIPTTHMQEAARIPPTKTIG